MPAAGTPYSSSVSVQAVAGPDDGTGDALGASGAELHDRTALGGPDDAVGLRGDARLVVDAQQQEGFHELRLDGRGLHRDDRFVREDGRAFRHGVNVAFELEVPQIRQELFVEDALAAQVVDVRVGKVQILHVPDDVGQAACDGEAAVVRHIAEEDVEIGLFFTEAVQEVPVAHGQLVKVREHGQVFFTHILLHWMFPSLFHLL